MNVRLVDSWYASVACTRNLDLNVGWIACTPLGIPFTVKLGNSSTLLDMALMSHGCVIEVLGCLIHHFRPAVLC